MENIRRNWIEWVAAAILGIGLASCHFATPAMAPAPGGHATTLSEHATTPAGSNAPAISSSERIELWPGGAPQAIDDRPVDKPWMMVYRPAAGHASGAGVIVCPGGGFNILAANLEGLTVGRYMAEHGITAFVLMYRVKNHGYSADVAMMDGRRAVRVVRADAASFGVDPARIGIMGFSAGGFLSSNVAQQNDAGQPDAADPVERVSCRPDFVGLIYGAGGGVKNGVNPGTVAPMPATHPPTFMALTAADNAVRADGALRYFQALRAGGVEAELHIYGGFGPHGQGMGTGAAPGYGDWPEQMVDWLRRTGMLTAEKRVAVVGKVLLDDKPLASGWLTLIPEKSEFAPIAGVLFADGKVRLPASGGPVPGPYRVEVRQLALTSITVPELDHEILFTKESPGAREPMTMNVMADTTNTLTLELRSR